MFRILIVDDEESIRRMLQKVLSLKYIVYLAANGYEALQLLNPEIDLIILDINMPGITGFELCKQIRNDISCPIIFLSAREKCKDRIQGLQIGGDDYIVKPFSLEELEARIDAHMRRETRKTKSWDVRFKDNLKIDYLKKIVWVGENKIEFSRREFEIVEFMSKNEGIVFSRETIYEKIWGLEADGNDNVIKEYVRKIRGRLSEYDEKNHIITVWGVGYKWVF